MQNDLLTYYNRRAKDYEELYYKADRQADLRKIANEITGFFAGEDVIEIACGTAYWTPFIAQNAKTVTATDISLEMLEIAHGKNFSHKNIEFKTADIYDLKALNRKFSELFGGFIWSHILREDMPEFLASIQGVLAPGAKAFFTDNIYVDGSSTPIYSTDLNRNTFQKRSLSDGSEHLVLKNFPDEAELREDLKNYAIEIEYYTTDYYWYLTCKFK